MSKATTDILTGDCLVSGIASGDVLYSEVPLSFMGGVDPRSGVVIDKHHPLNGSVVTGKILAVPSGRGSCAGSGAIFEMLLHDTAPAALVFCQKETILTLGVLIASELFDRRIPVVRLRAQSHSRLAGMGTVDVHGGVIRESSTPPAQVDAIVSAPTLDMSELKLSRRDLQLLSGDFGEAAKVSMRLILHAAVLEGADELIDVEMAHIDGNFYQGPGSLRFAEALLDMGAKVRVPSTMNALLIDRRRWKDQGVPDTTGIPSERLADVYEKMGIKPTYTCAPYLLDARPRLGQHIAWAESNAVMYANSVLGARTMKYPDYVDLLIAITGRAPNAGPHLQAGRRPSVVVHIEAPHEIDDSFFPVLGYHLGAIAPNDIPAVAGLQHHRVSNDDLKAFGAAFGTTSSSAMFHIIGITPEARSLSDLLEECDDIREITVSLDDLAATWRELNTASSQQVDLISLGNPHFSIEEFKLLSKLVEGRHMADRVELKITCGRDVYAEALVLGYVTKVEAFGADVINDTCWCLINEPVVADTVRTVMTNSAKYAHYGPAALGRRFHLRSIVDCFETACSGQAEPGPPRWLSDRM